MDVTASSSQAGPSQAPIRSRLRKASLRDQAYEVIKGRIITCRLRPGELLTEAAISESLGIGRTPVHQAIDRLVQDGLVEVMPRKGSIVKPLSLDEIINIADARMANESFCVRVAAKIADERTLNALRENVEQMKETSKICDIDTLARLDLEFHSLIANVSRNPIMIDILRNLHERSMRLWFISLRSNDQHVRIYEEHAAIIDAIAMQDQDQAEQTMRAHIDSFARNTARQI